METTIDEAGRVTIPQDLRTRFGFQPGMKLDVEPADGGVMLKPIAGVAAQPSEAGNADSSGRGLIWKDGVLVFMCEFRDPNFDLAAYVDAVRNERDYDVSGGLMR